MTDFRRSRVFEYDGKKFTFRYTHGWKKSHGICDGPMVKDREIRVDRKLTGQHRLEILLHELGHMRDWRASEEYVRDNAKDEAAILWQLGLRFLDEIE